MIFLQPPNCQIFWVYGSFFSKIMYSWCYMAPYFMVSLLLMYSFIVYRCCRRSGTTAADDDFFKHNKQLNRPVSPHLSILLSKWAELLVIVWCGCLSLSLSVYSPQLPAMLSISHRITGVILSCGMYTSPSLLLPLSPLPLFLSPLFPFPFSESVY